MSGKRTTRYLLLLLGALALLWWLSGLLSPGAKQRTFRETLLELDTNTIGAFTITPAPYKGIPPFHFRRTGSGTWRMFWANDSADADPAPVHDLLRLWSRMHVDRFAGRVADIAQRYDLTDSTADRFTIQAGGKQHDLLVGGQTNTDPSMTIVQLPGDVNAYAIEGPMGRYADQTFGGWLPKYLLTGDPKNWTRLTFNFPGNTGYVMERVNDRWTVGGTELDPERTERFLISLSRARGQEVTAPSDTLNAVPMYRLLVEDSTRSAPMIVVVFSSNGGFIVRSTLNPSTVMPFNGENEVPRMFRPPAAFMPQHEAADP